MKHLLICFLLLTCFACTKEENSPLITGPWTIVRTNAGTGTGSITTDYRPSSEVKVSFQSNGTISLSGPNPGTAHSWLWRFNHYQVLSASSIRLYNTATMDEAVAYFILNEGLSISYPSRCGYEEKFIRH